MKLVFLITFESVQYFLLLVMDNMSLLEAFQLMPDIEGTNHFQEPVYLYITVVIV